MSQNLGSCSPPLSHNVTLRRPPPPHLMCDVIYGCPLILKAKPIFLYTSGFVVPLKQNFFDRDSEKNGEDFRETDLDISPFQTTREPAGDWDSSLDCGQLQSLGTHL